ncbi:hypothetical protein HMPREF0083_00791 [Aneurinibacillus aneurinilyticus ATCC 12856]|uniref:Uncharacterized protein n=2 Tax=Aneurinibacillus aneurinilyticus TaxID=1391 RepID=U1YGA6_ANEAE|nr:hypothetical protein HMPREF0083_00791 [Aneurinibacillus aneurinilyticus ATCC 12856]
MQWGKIASERIALKMIEEGLENDTTRDARTTTFIDTFLVKLHMLILSLAQEHYRHKIKIPPENASEEFLR